VARGDELTVAHQRTTRLGDVVTAADLAAAGLGLAYGQVELVDVVPAWVELGSQLAIELSTDLGALAVHVEHIGSTSAAGLVAKPILDVAIGVRVETDLTDIVERLAERDWIYRGDAGDEGGHVFVLESRPGLRVAHAHVVEHEGEQWSRYLALRQALRTSEDARRRYSDEKRRLLAELGGDNSAGAYTAGKSTVVIELLGSADPLDASR
jgi:GrpB-like predicted nucleotidyltransferase (UPF0157 family)